MKTSIRTICPIFNTHRKAEEYTERFYLPCALRRNELRKDGRKRAIEFAKWKQKIRDGWSQVRVLEVQSGPTRNLPYGSKLPVRAKLRLGGLTQNDVTVEIYYGALDPYGRIIDGRAVEMQCVGGSDGPIYDFEGALTCDRTGELGFTVRIIPHHPDLAQKHETTLINWA